MPKKLTAEPEAPTYDRAHVRPGLPLPVWTPDYGPVEYVWAHKPAGARCLWACVWLTAEGRVRPDDILPLAEATPVQMALELADLAGAGRGDAMGAALLALELHARPDALHVLNRARAFLDAARPSYAEFVAPWSEPTTAHNGAQIWRRIYRNGWPSLLRPGGEN